MKVKGIIERFNCTICKREIIIYISGIGTIHQEIRHITCLDCQKSESARLAKQYLKDNPKG